MMVWPSCRVCTGFIASRLGKFHLVRRSFEAYKPPSARPECTGKSRYLSASIHLFSVIHCITPKPPLATHWMASTFQTCHLWRIKHCTLASHLTCQNCYNIMNLHGLCDLPLLFNSLFHDTTLNLARVHFESQYQKSGIYCLLVSVILHHSLHFVGI